jgi:hypothetical protein
MNVIIILVIDKFSLLSCWRQCKINMMLRIYDVNQMSQIQEGEKANTQKHLTEHNYSLHPPLIVTQELGLGGSFGSLAAINPGQREYVRRVLTVNHTNICKPRHD